MCRSFVREIYDGQLVIKLKNGLDFPAMDPWVGCHFYHFPNQGCVLFVELVFFFFAFITCSKLNHRAALFLEFNV